MSFYNVNINPMTITVNQTKDKEYTVKLDKNVRGVTVTDDDIVITGHDGTIQRVSIDGHTIEMDSFDDDREDGDTCSCDDNTRVDNLITRLVNNIKEEVGMSRNNRVRLDGLAELIAEGI